MMNFDEHMRKFANDKYRAFKLGKDRADLAELQDLIAVTDYPSGDVAEIVMAYMLGLFCSFRTDLYASMTANMDKRGVDFMLTRFRKYNYPIQMKFNKDDDRIYDSSISVIKLGPDRTFLGQRYLNTDAGNQALLRMLTECGAYEEEEIFDSFEENEGLEDLLIKAWRLIKN